MMVKYISKIIYFNNNQLIYINIFLFYQKIILQKKSIITIKFYLNN